MIWIMTIVWMIVYLCVGAFLLKSVFKFFTWSVALPRVYPDMFETFFVVMLWPLFIMAGIVALIVRGMCWPIYQFIRYVRYIHYGYDD